MRSLLETRQQNVVIQRWDISCGAAALATVLRYGLGVRVTEKQVAQAMLQATDPQRVRQRGGFSLLDMKRYAQSRGLKAEGYAGLTLEHAQRLVPLIVPMRIGSYDHFVVLRGLVNGHALIADPAFGNRRITVENFEQAWHGRLGFVVQGATSSGELRPRADDFLSVDARSVRAAMSVDRPAAPALTFR